MTIRDQLQIMKSADEDRRWTLLAQVLEQMCYSQGIDVDHDIEKSDPSGGGE